MANAQNDEGFPGLIFGAEHIIGNIRPEIPMPQMNDCGDQQSTQEKFDDFDARFPEVWDLFCRFTGQLIASGHTHYSADAVLHRVRWETSVTNPPNNHDPASKSHLKINNNFSAYYARKYHDTYPEFDGFFRTRKSKADKQD